MHVLPRNCKNGIVFGRDGLGRLGSLIERSCGPCPAILRGEEEQLPNAGERRIDELLERLALDDFWARRDDQNPISNALFWVFAAGLLDERLGPSSPRDLHDFAFSDETRKSLEGRVKKLSSKKGVRDFLERKRTRVAAELAVATAIGGVVERREIREGVGAAVEDGTRTAPASDRASVPRGVVDGGGGVSGLAAMDRAAGLVVGTSPDGGTRASEMGSFSGKQTRQESSAGTGQDSNSRTAGDSSSGGAWWHAPKRAVMERFRRTFSTSSGDRLNANEDDEPAVSEATGPSPKSQRLNDDQARSSSDM